MCGVLSAGWGLGVGENSRGRTELDKERSPELKERKPLESVVSPLK